MTWVLKTLLLQNNFLKFIYNRVTVTGPRRTLIEIINSETPSRNLVLNQIYF